MLNYTIELKNKEDIESLCYTTEDGTKGLDGVAFDYAILKDNDFYTDTVTVIGANKMENNIAALLINNNRGSIYIHPSWVKSFNGEVISNELKKVDDNKIKVTDTYIVNTNTGDLIDSNTLPLCTKCNAITTNKYKGIHMCKSCIEDLTTAKAYNYKPSFKFIGKQIKADKDNNVWYGVEIEVSTDKEKLKEFTFINRDSVYLKSDSTIQGSGHNVEIVTHPHSFSELMSKTKSSWVNTIDNLPTNDSDANGMHIHISRTAFVDDRHYSLFYFLLYRMNKIATKVGGRELTDYCKLIPSGKVHTKEKDNTKTPSGRTVFLNESNKDTVEARFFKGTTNSEDIRANIQLLESIIKYTKYHSRTVSVDGWFQYITKKSKKYKELLKKVGDIDSKDKEIEVIYTQPKYRTILIDAITIKDLHNLVQVQLIGGDILDVSFEYMYSDYLKLIIDKECYTKVVDIDDIHSIKVEE